MKKRNIWLLSFMTAALFFSAPVPYVRATEDTEYEEETEDPYPDSYYLPIESNEIEGWPQGPTIEADAAVVMDAETGTFLYSKNMDAKEYPASITKIMTTLLAIENGNLDEEITFSESAVYNLEEGSSHAGIQVGEVMTMEKALYGLMLESANDIANGIAEQVAGSQDAFAELMTQKAAELGCVNTHFTNAHGLNNEEHYTCARDMALITQEALKYPKFLEIAGTLSYNCPETNMVDEIRYWNNHNQMIQPDAEYYYEGALGGKTGFTSDALNTLVSYAEKEDRTLICVELRVNGKDKAYSESHQMLDYAFENFENMTVSIPNATMTRYQLLGIKGLGKLQELQNKELQKTIMTGDSKVTLSLPKGASLSDVTVKNNENGGVQYYYNGWEVGDAEFSFTSMDFEVDTPHYLDVDFKELHGVVDPGVKGVVQVVTRKAKAIFKVVKRTVKDVIDKIPGWLEDLEYLWWDLVDWVYENDIMMAVLGLVLLIILIPILIIAWTRNAKTVRIRKQRKKEREERVRIEQYIDNKSVSEIEAELRAELEKDRLERQQAIEEANRMHADEMFSEEAARQQEEESESKK